MTRLLPLFLNIIRTKIAGDSTEKMEKIKYFAKKLEYVRNKEVDQKAGKGSENMGKGFRERKPNGKGIPEFNNIPCREGKKLEKEGLQNVEFLETLINTIPTPIFYKDSKGKYIGCNELFAKMIIGLPKEAIIGKDLLELCSQLSEAQELQRLDKELFNTEEKGAYERKFRCSDGKKRDFVVIRNTFKNKKGELGILVGVMQEVTERKRAEETLLNNISFLETLQDNIPNPVFQRDKKGVYRSCNERFARQIMALPKERVIGHSFQELQQRLDFKTQQIFYEFDPKILQEGTSQSYETEQFCADGIKRNFLFNKAAYKDKNGKIAGIAGVITDISKLKRIEKALSENINFLETLLDNIPNPVFQRNKDGVYISCNEKFAGLIGLSKKELIGTTFLTHRTRFNKKIIEMYYQDKESLLKRGGNQHYETELYLPESGKKTFLFTKAAYKNDSGKVAGIVGMMTDITERKKAEQELKKRSEELSEAKKRLDIALEATKMGIWEWDAEKNTLSWDENLFNLTGLRWEEFDRINGEGKSKNGKEEGAARDGIYSKVILAEDKKKVQKALKKLKEGKTDIYELEHSVIKPDGLIRYYSVKGRAFRNSEGKLLKIIGTTHDITERKEAEKALQDSDNKYRISSEQTGHIIYDMDILNGRIDWAGAIEEVTGYAPKDVRNFNIEVLQEYIHPEDRKRVVENYKEFWTQGKEKFWNEFRLRKKDGSYCYVEDMGVFLKDENGKPYRAMGVHKDVSERKLAEKKLQESEERYRTFIQNFRGIAYRLDLNFKPLFMGGNVEGITGYAPESFLSGKIKWKELIEPEDRVFIYGNKEEFNVAPNHMKEKEYRLRHRDGKIHWVREIIQNLSDETGASSVIQGSIYDITEEKIAEEKLKKTEEIRKKEVHHRVKNNLQVISSLLELQADKFEDQKVQEAFRESQNRIISMAIIHEELYREQPGDENKENIDFAAYLEKLTDELIRTYAVESEGLDLKLAADRVFLGIDTSIPLGILINELVSNALKHAFPKEIKEKKKSRKKEIEIRLLKPEYKGAAYTLLFSDNGKGLPKGFDFRNTDSLGLQLVNTLADQLEGKIELIPEAKGTKYRIEFRDIGEGH